MPEPRDRPPTIGIDVDMVVDGRRVVGTVLSHPPGVTCQFAAGVCSCGRLDVGVTPRIAATPAELDAAVAGDDRPAAPEYDQAAYPNSDWRTPPAAPDGD